RVISVEGPKKRAPRRTARQARALAFAEATRALGHDTTPGHNQLKHYWTRGEGLARWIGSPHQFETLRDLLLEHVSADKADRFAAEWVHEVTGFWPGSDMHRVLEGGKPRGKKIGPG